MSEYEVLMLVGMAVLLVLLASILFAVRDNRTLLRHIEQLLEDGFRKN